MTTRTNILECSLEMFNLQGDRNVTTNHVAQSLGISPGNLYYHFRNKEHIIRELFVNYSVDFLNAVAAPRQHSVEVGDMIDLVVHSMQVIWKYRFLAISQPVLLDKDPELRDLFLKFQEEVVKKISSLYQACRSAGLISLSDKEIETLTLNSWLIAHSWVGYILTQKPTLNELNDDDIIKGAIQVLGFLRRDINKEYLAAFDVAASHTAEIFHKVQAENTGLTRAES